MLKTAIGELVERRALTRDMMQRALETIFNGEATASQIGAFLIALRMKGETPEELAAAAEVMRARATPIRTPAGRPILDTCGTGGDGANTLNISTAVAFVAAAAGATVAKHGNRSVSSRCGSADVLEALGVDVGATPATVEASIESIGIGFLFAPALHGVMKHVAPARREVGVRSIFNLLGPLANPARATRQLLGVYDPALVPVLARTLLALGCERALVVHGDGGLDELSPSGETRAALLEDGSVRELRIQPEDAGAARFPLEAIRGGSPEENARALRAVLAGEEGAAAEAVVLNAAAAIWMAGLTPNLREGGELARSTLRSGEALARLEGLASFTQQRKAAS